MNTFPLLLQLACGLVGGNIAGAAWEKLDMGVLGNSLVGLVGGGLGGQLYQYLLNTSGANSADLSVFMASFTGGSIGGAVAVVIIGVVRSFMRRG